MTGAEHRLCSFRLGAHLLGVEASRVQEVVRGQELTRVPLAAAAIGGLLNLRGQIVTAINLRVRLGLPAPEWGWERTATHLIVRTGDELVSLLVDEIGDVLAVPQDALEPPPPTLRAEAKRLIVGAYKLPEHLLLALDSDRAACVAGEETDGTCHR